VVLVLVRGTGVGRNVLVQAVGVAIITIKVYPKIAEWFSACRLLERS
jgi:hypothetical protein